MSDQPDYRSQLEREADLPAGALSIDPRLLAQRLAERASEPDADELRTYVTELRSNPLFNQFEDELTDECARLIITMVYAEPRTAETQDTFSARVERQRGTVRGMLRVLDARETIHRAIKITRE